MQETAIGGAAREFPMTRWTLIRSASEGPAARKAALEELLTAYWKPLYFYVRRKGLSIEAAKDAIQGFYSRLLEDDFLSRLDPERGHFRGYLRTALDRHLINQHEADHAQKRGGSAKRVSLDFEVAERECRQAKRDPDAAFDHEWAIGLMERALSALRREFEDGTRRGNFDVVMKFFQPGTPPPYPEAAQKCGMTAPQFKAFLHRARTRFRDLVKQEVAQTVDGAADEEMAALVRILK